MRKSIWRKQRLCVVRISMAHKKSKHSKKLPTADFTVTSVAVAGEAENGGSQDIMDSNATVAAAASLGQEIDANSILNYLMQERREDREERKRDKEEQGKREETLEKEREECMMNMFKVQMDMFLKHHSAAKEQEQEFLKTQQIEVRTTQKELMDQQRQASIFQHVLSRLPKLSEKSKVGSFFLQFEKTLEDHDIPSRKWLQALQASLDGSLVDVYWDTFRQEERDTYEISKCTLMKWCVFFHYRVHTAGWSSEDEIFGTIQEAFQESINHV